MKQLHITCRVTSKTYPVFKWRKLGAKPCMPVYVRWPHEHIRKCIFKYKCTYNYIHRRSLDGRRRNWWRWWHRHTRDTVRETGMAGRRTCCDLSVIVNCVTCINYLATLVKRMLEKYVLTIRWGFFFFKSNYNMKYSIRDYFAMC